MKKIVSLTVICAMLLVTGCSAFTKSSNADASDSASERASVAFEDTDYMRLKDNDVLYKTQDPTSVVTIYLTATKGNSTESTDHTWKELNSHDIYYYSDLGIARYGVNGLVQIGDANGPLEGALGYGLTVPNATVTIRGQTSSYFNQKSYKIKLKSSSPSWHGQTVFNLNKHQEDGMRFRNKLMTDLMQEVPDLVSLQTQFVHLYVKDNTQGNDGTFTDYGLFTHVEQANKGFLERHGLDKNGQLYKINSFEFYRYEDVIKLKTDPDYDEAAFEEMLEIVGNDDHTKLIAMLDDVNNYSLPISDVMDKWFDEDNLLTWMAFNILTGNIDTQSRNYLLYSPLNEDRWYFIDWDCDAAFSLTENNLLGISNDEGWEHGVSNYWGSVLFQRLLKNDAYRNLLAEKVQELRQIITKEKITSMTEDYASVVKPYAYSAVDKVNEPLSSSEYDTVLAAIPDEPEKNYDFFTESLASPMPFFIGVPYSDENGTTFTWDPSFDFDASAIRYTLEVADNLNFTDPVISVSDLVMNEYRSDNYLPEGHYYIRMKASNANNKEQYAFDYYISDDSVKYYGIKAITVSDDGSISNG